MPKVLSTINGTPFSWAIFATASISIRFIPGFPMLSINTAFVFSLIAALKFSGSSGFTKIVLIPSFGSVVANRLYVPPYSVLAPTISSPAPAIFNIEY